MNRFKEEFHWSPRECRERLHQLIRKIKKTRVEDREIVAIKDYLRSMGKD